MELALLGMNKRGKEVVNVVSQPMTIKKRESLISRVNCSLHFRSAQSRAFIAFDIYSLVTFLLFCYKVPF